MTHLEHEEEARLVERILAGETDLFQEVVSRYRDKVAGMIFHITNSREDVEDIAQDVFLAVYRHLGSFERRSSLGTWIYRITVNKCRDWQRRTYARRPGDLFGLFWNDRASPTVSAEGLDERDAVRTAVNNLSEKYRMIIILYYYHDLSCQEIADLLQMPKKTVETRLARGRGQIAKKLDHGGEPACTETL